MLVVPEGGGGLAGPVIVGYDGSERARPPRSRVAADLFPARRKIVVNVWESLVRHSLGGRALASGPLESARTMSEELDACFDAIATDIAEQGAEPHARRTAAIARAVEAEGSAWHGLLAAARAEGAALIVVGSRGRGAIASTVLGSVSSGLVHNADVPVLVVPDPADIHRTRTRSRSG